MVARPAGGREVVGSNPAAPTIMEEKLKKIILILFVLMTFSLACGEENLILEPIVTQNSIDFPFESRENGKFKAIYRNNTNESIPYTLAIVKMNELVPDSRNIDFCPEIINIRKGVDNSGWIMINYNYLLASESSVDNQNDHPNLVSYSLPMGTYIVLTMDSEGCSDEQYDVFDITTNEAIETEG